jgi:SPP1 gp7 family putative phage head morphogenesis protein
LTVNELLQSQAVSHAHYLERYKSHVVASILDLLNDSEMRIVRALKESDPDTLTAQRLERLLSDIREIIAEGVAELKIGISDEILAFGEYEAGFQARSIQSAVPIEINITQPSPDQIYAAVTARPFDGLILADQIERYGRAKIQRIERVIRQGWVEGQTIQQVARRVRGSRAANYTDGIIAETRRQAESMVRTALNHTHSVARQSLFDSNRDLIKGVQYVATLDTRTTMICASLDGKVFPIDSGPRPPQHFGCRSTVTPVIRSWKEIGVDIDEAPENTRASMNGQVPQKLTYGQWLKRQPASIQREALGESRYKMFRDGTPIESFVRDGRALTLDELRKAETAA